MQLVTPKVVSIAVKMAMISCKMYFQSSFFPIVPSFRIYYFSIYYFLRSVGAQASKLGVLFIFQLDY